jgi:hypothetical protein
MLAGAAREGLALAVLEPSRSHKAQLSYTVVRYLSRNKPLAYGLARQSEAMRSEHFDELLPAACEFDCPVWIHKRRIGPKK